MELITWLVNTNDWFKKNDYENYMMARKKDNKIDQIFLGLIQVFNSFKHNMSITNMVAF